MERLRGVTGAERCTDFDALYVCECLRMSDTFPGAPSNIKSWFLLLFDRSLHLLLKKREDLDFYFFSICHFIRFQYDVQVPKRIEKNYLGDTVEAIDEVSLSKSIFKSGGFFDPKVAFIFPSPTSPSPRSWADSRRNWGLLGLSTNGGELTEDSLLDLKKKRLRHREMRNFWKSTVQIPISSAFLIKICHPKL